MLKTTRNKGIKNILVVDNHPLVLSFMTHFLEKLGHRVMTAVDGIEALEALKGFVPDVIFVDLVMPNIGGDKLCRIVRQRPELGHTFLVILSAIATEEKARISSYGADCCIAKGPFNKMGRHVKRVLDQLASGKAPSLKGKVIGEEDLHERAITRELLSSRRHFQATLNHMQEGILELNQRFEIVYANPAGARLMGMPEETLLSSKFSSFFGGADRERVERLLEKSRTVPQHISEESPATINQHQVSLDLLWVEDQDNSTTLAIVRDITHRKQLQERLQQAQKMEAIGVLAGGIAHQFNNALQVITGGVDLLDMNFAGDKAPMAIIHTAVDRMQALTRQLLAYAGGGHYLPEPACFNSLIEETVKLVEKTVPASVLLQLDLAPDVSRVEADVTQLQMAIAAIVANAVEAIPGTGQIRIVTRNEILEDPLNAQLPDLMPGRYVSVAITDTGKGMDAATRRRLFEPFFSDKFQGRGLGMAAVYGIVKNHGGGIAVDSHYGRGTCVRVYLPAIEE
ncbi:MAG TPA: ATP-binding protein [Desulfobacterales bacterium]|jgi:two-component system, cell cycle sensor histidine kinase and response regulator CckA|nr:ATP-binding protein [Desulfobacterales bacterium]